MANKETVSNIYINGVPCDAKIPCHRCKTGSAHYLLIHANLCRILCEECATELYASAREYEEQYEDEDQHSIIVLKVTGIKAEDSP